MAPEVTWSIGRAFFFPALSYSKCLTVENSQAVHRAGEYACNRMEARDRLQGRSWHFQLAQMPAFILKVIKQGKIANTSTSELEARDTIVMTLSMIDRSFHFAFIALPPDKIIL